MSTSADSLEAVKTASAGVRATWVRWHIVALLMGYSFMTWFNRVSMSVAYDERIGNQFGISPTMMGTVYSAFLVAYTIFMTPGGWFIDRFGARSALAVMGLGSAVFCVLTGVVGFAVAVPALVVVSFLVIRSIMGAFTAPIYPASSRTIANWIPFPQRGGANGLVQGSAALGIATTFVIFGFLIDHLDWPRAFLISGTVTALLALLWTFYARNDPLQHSGVNEAERQLIRQDDPPIHPVAAVQVEEPLVSPDPWWSVLRSRSLVFLTLSYAAIGYFEYLLFFWMHYYFETVLRLGKTESRYYAMIPLLAMTVGMVTGGWLSDWLVRVLGNRLGRSTVPVLGMTTSGITLILGVLASDPMWIVFWFSLALGAVGACEGPMWMTSVELGGKRGGTAAGVFNTGGNIGGNLAPLVTPFVSEQLSWGWSISLASLFCFLGVLLWLWINPGERIDKQTSA